MRLTASLKFPFLSEKEVKSNTKYESIRRNIIEKVRLYHENRVQYEVICKKYESERLQFDSKVRFKEVSYKKSQRTRGEKKTIHKEGNNNSEQINLF